MKGKTKLWIGLMILVILSPLGIILPARFNAGSAWGEWSAQEIQKMTGHAPSGMAEHADKWKAPMPDYAFQGQAKAPIAARSISYLISGIIGVAIVLLLALLIGRILAKREESDSP